MEYLLTTHHLTKTYGRHKAVDGVSLHLRQGDIYGLIGRNGAGKTTLLRMIIGFNSIEGGEIKIDGKVINNIPTNKRNMGMVFQNYAIFPHMSVPGQCSLRP